MAQENQTQVTPVQQQSHQPPTRTTQRTNVYHIREIIITQQKEKTGSKTDTMHAP